MKEFTEAARPAILDLLKMHGPTNVPQLAKLLQINPTAARQQLAVLQREGLVTSTVQRRPVGRPTHLWSLTRKAEALFPQAYGALALALLRQIRQTDGEAKIDKLLTRRTGDLMRRYAERLAGKPLEEKLRELARIRDEEGYIARADRRTLTEHHCPIAAIASEFPQVCLFEKRLFDAVLGIKTERTDHLASGGSACVYRAIAAKKPSP